MGRAVTGVLILLFLAILTIVVNVVNAESQTITGSDEAPDCAGGNSTACQEDYDGGGFFDVLRSIGVPALPTGTPVEVNVLWIVILGTLLALGIYLLVTSAIPLTSE